MPIQNWKALGKIELNNEGPEVAVRCLLTPDFLDLEQEAGGQVNPVRGVLTREVVCPVLSKVLNFPRTFGHLQMPALTKTLRCLVLELSKTIVLLT